MVLIIIYIKDKAKINKKSNLKLLTFKLVIDIILIIKLINNSFKQKGDQMVNWHVNRHGYITGIHHHRHHRHHHCHNHFPRINWHHRVVDRTPVDPRASAMGVGLIGMVGGAAFTALGIGLCFAPGGQPAGITLAVVGGVIGLTSAATFALGVLGLFICD